METTDKSTATKNTSKACVLSFLQALNSEDFKTARSFADNDLTFDGVMGSRRGADVYMKDMEHMKFKYDIIKAFEDGTDVAVFYNIDMSGIKVFTSGWYQVEKGKIKSIKVVFDPRPVLEAAPKK